MAALDTYRRHEVVAFRRNTVGSPPPTYSFNALANSRFPLEYPYRSRRSTVSGQSQGHNVNAAPPLAAHGSDAMWSASASTSPILGPAPLPASSSTPSSASDSPRPSTFDSYAFSTPPSSFSLCPSPEYDPLAQPRMPPPLLPPSFHRTPLSPAPSAASFSDPPAPPDDSHDPDELTRLRHRVRDLEFINDLVRLRVAELESDNKSRVHQDLGLGLSFTPPDWDARTEARRKRFCALNRAGNALCAWHDSRRERRAYPPRMAPHETLNCGCTYKEALFEESLARNDVGAFYPGESVRMDPALRNPLLKLLEERYGYRDGDFERTESGGWREGEDARSWEQRAVGQRPTSKRER